MREESTWDFFTAALPFTKDVNQSDFAGNNWLHVFTFNSFLHTAEELELLVNSGVDVNDRNSFGSTALIRAAAGNRADQCLVLLKAGADPTLKSAEARDFQFYINLFYHDKTRPPTPDQRAKYLELQEYLTENFSDVDR